MTPEYPVQAKSRRAFLTAAGATAISGAPLLSLAGTAPRSGRDDCDLQARILALFDPLPGEKAIKIWAPATHRAPEFLVARNAGAQLFVASAIKAFLLCERLRQLDAPTVVQRLLEKQLTLDASVWSPDSEIFNPPHLSGLVNERTTLEAMILHSDNTATDMEFAQTGPDKVRAFLAAIGLRNSLVPDSARVFFAYLVGLPNYKTVTWEELTAVPDDAPIVNPPLNHTETLASSSNDLVAFYSRSLQGEFFTNAQTLAEYRRILSLGVGMGGELAPFGLGLPLGVSGFAKSGSIDEPDFHAVCVAGGMFFATRWAYFAAIINWEASTKPDTANAFLAAVQQALALTKDGLSTETRL